MVQRLVSVGDDFTLPASVKAVDANLPANLQPTALSATILAAVQAASTDAATIIALGSSISFGEYPDKLGTRLAEYTEMFPPVIVKVAAGGRVTQGMKENLPAALETYRPSVVIIETSVNDSRADLNIASETTRLNLRKMVSMCKIAGARPILLTSTPVDYTQYNAPTQYNAASVTKQLVNNTNTRALAVEMGVELVDLYPIFDQLTTTWDSDGLHPNTYGADVMGQMIAAKITGNPAPFLALTRTTVATDSFTRANSTTTLGTTETGAKTWTADVGTWGITSNQAANITGAHSRATIDAPSANVAVSASLLFQGSGGGMGVIARGIDATTSLRAVAYASLDAVYITKLDAGVETHLTNVPYTFNVGTAYGLRFEVIADKCKVFVNGILAHSYTLSSADATRYAAGVKCGLYSMNQQDNSGLIDDFKLETIAYPA